MHNKGVPYDTYFDERSDPYEGVPMLQLKNARVVGETERAYRVNVFIEYKDARGVSGTTDKLVWFARKTIRVDDVGNVSAYTNIIQAKEEELAKQYSYRLCGIVLTDTQRNEEDV